MTLRALSVSILLLCFSSYPFAKTFDDSEVKHIDYPAWFEEFEFFDLTEELEKVKRNGKKGLMVLFTTNGCSYCDRFIETSLGDEELADMVQDNFVSIGMEIFDDTEMISPLGESLPVKVFAKREGAGFSPTLLFYNKEGRRVLRVVGYRSPERFRIILDYVNGKHYESVSLRDYSKQVARKSIPSSSDKSLINDSLFSNPPYGLERKRVAAEQPLLVLFEEASCSSCTSFHSKVLAKKDIRGKLEKFEVVRLDVSDDKNIIVTPDGSRMTASAWFRQTGFIQLPALMFFDERGNKVLETDALVLHQRMMNSINYVLERAYEKGWTYQRFARSKGIERSQKNKQMRSE